MRERATRDRQAGLAADRQDEAAARQSSKRRSRQESGVAAAGGRGIPRSPQTDERAASEILIPGYVDPSGRDSLGRGLDAGSIAARRGGGPRRAKGEGGAVALPVWCLPRSPDTRESGSMRW